MKTNGKIPVRHVLTILILAAWSLSSSAQGIVAVRNNVLWDATGTPNLGLEVTLSKHFTLGLDAAFKPWPRFLAWDNDVNNDAHWRHLTLAPELRYYPKQAAKPGIFYGANLVYSHFNLGSFNIPIGPYADLEVHRIQGDIYGGALFIGYGWGLGKHFRFEIEAGAGAGYRQATLYECTHCGPEIGPSNGLTIIPKLGVNFAWNIEGRKKIRQQISNTISEITSIPDPQKLDDVPVILDTIVRTEPITVTPPPEPEPEPQPEPEPEPEPQPEPQPGPERHPLLRPIGEYVPYSPDMVLRRDQGSIQVAFQFAKYNLLRSVYVRGEERDNGEGLDTIESVIKEAIQDQDINPIKVQIVGFASIDGNQWGNERLALRRAEAVKSYIKWKTGLAEENFEVVGGGEAWTELMDELAERHEAGQSKLTQAEYERVLKIVDSVKDLDTRELRIKELADGAVYQKLLKGLFADQRSAVCVRVYYDDNQQ